MVGYDSVSAWNDNSVEIAGVNESIGTSFEDLSNFDADNSYLTQTGTETLYVSSSSSGDTYNGYNHASGGARIVRLHYLDSNWDETTADAYMSGVSSIEIASDVKRVNKLEVISAGDSGTAIGDIIVASGGTSYLKIDADSNESYNGYYYVPDGKNLIITDTMFYPMLDNGSNLEFIYKIEEPKLEGTTTHYIENNTWVGSYLVSGDTSIQTTFNTPIIVKDRCRVRLNSKSDGTGKAIGYIRGYLVEEKS